MTGTFTLRTPRLLAGGVVALLVALTLVAAPSAAYAATTLEVGAGKPYKTIQSAVNAAQNGDTVHVAAGTYTENVQISGKYIWVKGDSGAVIQAASSGNAAVAITNVPYSNLRTKLSGFTIQGGKGAPGQGGGVTIALNAAPEIFDNIIQNNNADAYGGGISIHTNSNPIIRNNTIRGNYAFSGGGGIFAVGNSSPVIFGNTITGNWTSGVSISNGGSSGGGIYLENSGDPNARSFPVVLKNTISGNTAEFAGGGVMLRTGVNAIIEGNTIANNTASYGGGVHVETTGSSVVIATNTISGNTALVNGKYDGSGYGGGIALFDRSNSEIRANTISGNRASTGGGGISSSESANSQIIGNLIKGNQTSYGAGANHNGGGLYVGNSTINAVNNQFIGNAADVGGAIAVLKDGGATIVNNTVVKNQEPADRGGAIFIQQLATSATIHNNIVIQNQGYQIFEEVARPGDMRNNLIASPSSASTDPSNNRWSGLYWAYDGSNGRATAAEINRNVNGASGTIDTDPGFANIGADDYSLTSVSTAINAGVDTGVADDFRNAIRMTLPIDIGAYEYEASPTIKSHVFRFWSDSKKGHFYTISEAERDLVASTSSPLEWRYEYVAYDAFTTQIPGTIPLFRFVSQLHQGHFYTANAAEKDLVIDKYSDEEYLYEGVAYYVYPLDTAASSNAVFRFWSRNTGHHFYTASAAERDYVIQTSDDNTWHYEGPNFRVPR